MRKTVLVFFRKLTNKRICDIHFILVRKIYCYFYTIQLAI